MGAVLPQLTTRLTTTHNIKIIVLIARQLVTHSLTDVTTLQFSSTNVVAGDLLIPTRDVMNELMLTHTQLVHEGSTRRTRSFMTVMRREAIVTIAAGLGTRILALNILGAAAVGWRNDGTTTRTDEGLHVDVTTGHAGTVVAGLCTMMNATVQELVADLVTHVGLSFGFLTTIRTADGSTEMLLAVQWIAADMGTEIRSRQLGDKLRRHVGRRGQVIGRPAGNVLLVVLASTFDLDGLCARRTRAQMTLLFAMMNSTRKQLIANMVTGGHRLYTKLTMGSQLRVETTTTRTVGTRRKDSLTLAAVSRMAFSLAAMVLALEDLVADLVAAVASHTSLLEGLEVIFGSRFFFFDCFVGRLLFFFGYFVGRFFFVVIRKVLQAFKRHIRIDGLVNHMVLNLVLLGVRLRRDVLLQESRILRIAASQLIVDIATSHHLVLLSAIAGNINLIGTLAALATVAHSLAVVFLTSKQLATHISAMKLIVAVAALGGNLFLATSTRLGHRDGTGRAWTRMAQQRTGVSTMAAHHPVAGIAAGVGSQRVEGAVGRIALLKGIDMLMVHTTEAAAGLGGELEGLAATRALGLDGLEPAVCKELQQLDGRIDILGNLLAKRVLQASEHPLSHAVQVEDAVARGAGIDLLMVLDLFEADVTGVGLIEQLVLQSLLQVCNRARVPSTRNVNGLLVGSSSAETIPTLVLVILRL